jgi:hypothetical protein
MLFRLTALLLFTTGFVHGQMIAPDSLREKKRFGRASIELMITELLPWSYNFFVRDAEFARITFKSIGHNLKPSSWEWDDNQFKTNQFAHPYHGNLYFSSFRTNGYNFWQSAPAAFAGSFIWEVAGETKPPAPNDFINTSFGGIALGEMTFRISNYIIDNTQRGPKRTFQEIMGLVINPINGLNRILDRKWGRVMADPEKNRGRHMTAQWDFGARKISKNFGEVFESGNVDVYARAQVAYGSPFVDLDKPFANFRLRFEISNNDSSSLNLLQVGGFITGKKLRETERSSHVWALTFNYDYVHNSQFEFGGQSVNFNVFSTFPVGKTKMITRFGAGPVIIGAVPDVYLFYGEGRNYDYGSGASTIADIRLDFLKRFTYSLNYRAGWFSTLNGNDSNHIISVITSDLRFALTKHLSIAAEWGSFNLYGYYKHFEDTKETFPYFLISTGIRLDY